MSARISLARIRARLHHCKNAPRKNRSSGLVRTSTAARHPNDAAVVIVDFKMNFNGTIIEVEKGCPPQSALGPNQFGSKLVARALVAFW